MPPSSLNASPLKCGKEDSSGKGVVGWEASGDEGSDSKECSLST